MQARGIGGGHRPADAVRRDRAGPPKARAAAYKSPRDLKGLKIGVTAPGSSTNFFVSALLASDGLKPDDVAIIGVGASSNAVAAMKKGEIDAISNLDPVMTRLEHDGDVVAVADTRTAEGMKKYYGGDYAASCIYSTQTFLDKNPNTARAVARAIVRALHFAKKSSVDEVLAAIPAEYYAGDKDIYKAALAKSIEGYSPDGKFSLEGAENVYKVLKLFEPSVMSASVDVSKTFDNRSVEAAARAVTAAAARCSGPSRSSARHLHVLRGRRGGRPVHRGAETSLQVAPGEFVSVVGPRAAASRPLLNVRRA
jgi:NitT/TauT family transport system substrate-binding protein